MHAGHQLTSNDRAVWLERNGFDCPVYKAKITAQTCASNRNRPLLTEVGVPPADGTIQLHRNPKCSDACPTWLGQRDKYAGATGSASTKRGTCAWCGRTNMAIVNRGLDGACYKLFKDGVIEQAEDGKWCEIIASTPATPPAPDQQRADEELAQRLETAAAPIVDATGASIHVPAGDLAADLANPANIRHMPGQAPPVLLSEGEAASELLTQARALAAPAAQGDAADDFVPYTGIMPAPKSELVIILDMRGRIGITAATVREFGLADCTHMELFWSASRRQIGLRPATDSSPHKLAVARGRKGKLAQIHGSGFYKAFGLKPVYGRYPLHRAPSGMLVATIELESEEAKAS